MKNNLIIFIFFGSILFSDGEIEKGSYESKVDSLGLLSKKSPERAIRFAREILEDSYDGKPNPLEYKVLNKLGEIYLEIGLDTEALSYFIDAHNQLQSMGERKTPWLKINIGNVYYQQGKYIVAREYYLQALDVFESWDTEKDNARLGQVVALSNLGRIELAIKNYDKSLTIFKKALDIQRESIHYRVFLRNPKKIKNNNFGVIRNVAYQHHLLSSLYREWGQYDLALRECATVDSILSVIKKRVKAKDNELFKVLGNNYSEKTILFTKSQEYSKGLKTTRIASQLLKKWPLDFAAHMQIEAEFYNQQDSLYLALEAIDRGIKVCVLNGMTVKEVELLNQKMDMLKINKLERSALDIAQKIVKKNKFLHQNRMNSLFESMEYKSELLVNRKNLKNLKSREFVLYLILGVACIILGVIIIGYRNKKKYSEQKKMVIEKEKKLVEAELKNKEKELIDMSAHIVSKNDLLNSILNDIDYHTSLISNKDDRKIMRPLKKRIQSQIDDVADWEQFQIQFFSVYPDFVELLKEKYADLRTGDIKICCYLRMNMNTKEIARVSGLSVRAIENKRYRLRKKLKLETEVSLESFIASVGNKDTVSNE